MHTNESKQQQLNSAERKIIDMWGAVHDAIITGLAREFTQDKIEKVIGEPLRQAGKENAKDNKSDARTIGRAILAVESHWNIQGTVLQETPFTFVREVTYCPWAYFKPLSCRVLAWYMEGFCEGINPRCKYRLEKLIPEGDEKCLWSITCQGEQANTEV